MSILSIENCVVQIQANCPGNVFTMRYGDLVSSCKGARITPNNRKISYDKPNVVFGGYLISEAGYSIDLSLTKALPEFPIPKLQTNIQSFCGLANQLCNFSDDNVEALAPFKYLMKKCQKFKWNDD